MLWLCSDPPRASTLLLPLKTTSLLSHAASPFMTIPSLSLQNWHSENEGQRWACPCEASIANSHTNYHTGKRRPCRNTPYIIGFFWNVMSIFILMGQNVFILWLAQCNLTPAAKFHGCIIRLCCISIYAHKTLLPWNWMKIEGSERKLKL